MIPFRPQTSFFFTVLFFAGLAGLHWRYCPDISASLGGAVHEFVQREHSSRPKHPPIVIAGASLSGMSFHIPELEKRTGMNAGKISLSATGPEAMLWVFECFPKELSHTKIVLLELAPARLSGEIDIERRKTFESIRHPDNTSLMFHLWSKRRSIGPFFKGLAKSKDETGYFESRWDENSAYAKKTRRRYARAEAATHAPKEPESVPPAKQERDYNENQIAALYQFADMCRRQGIFLVICCTPHRNGALNYSQPDLNKTSDDRYLQILQDLNQRRDCTVLIAGDFTQITSEGTDSDYLFDDSHMTEKGAKVYTNWLVDRLMEMPKTAETMRNRTTTIR